VRQGITRVSPVVVHLCNPAVIGNSLDQWLCDLQSRTGCVLMRTRVRVRERRAYVNAPQCLDLPPLLCHQRQTSDLTGEISRVAQMRRRRNSRDVTSAAGPTMTCTDSGDGTVTPRSPRERIAGTSIVDVSATPMRSRLAATSTLRTLPRPPSAARRLLRVAASRAAAVGPLGAG
jgi:hypothetical protein